MKSAGTLEKFKLRKFVHRKVLNIWDRAEIETEKCRRK
jgi:hypothetical protein